ncbi:MAG: glycosyltransferase [Nitrospira sp. CR1.3]|nr:glycosyltransferase [Nitrospira sp. CR1.3]
MDHNSVKKHSVLVIGPTPPPYHGVSVAIEGLLHSRLKGVFDVIHLELADRRGIGHVNKPDLHDVILFLRQWFRLWWLLLIRRPQVVYLVVSQHTIGFIRDSLLIWPSWLFGARIIAHLHGGAFREWHDSRWALLRGYVRAVLRTVTRMIILGESLRPIFSGLLPDERVVVVPNGVEVPDDDDEREHPNGTRPWRVLHLNTLNRMKGTLVLLAAIPTVLRHRRDVAFVFAGSWSHPLHRRVAEWYIAQHRLQPYVTFVGEVTGREKEASLRSADLFVFPGIQQEGQPLVVLEAMAAALPIVFTNQGCLRETVVNGECGVEAYCEDPYDLAVRICALLDHPDDVKQLGRNARRRGQLLFTTERHVDRMIRVFAEVAANPVPWQSPGTLGTIGGKGKS